MLLSGGLVERTEAASALACLVRERDTHDAVVLAGGTEGLLRLLFESATLPNATAPLDSASALCCLASSDDEARLIIVDDAAADIVSLLTQRSVAAAVKTAAAKLLTVLARNEECRSVIELNGVDALLQLVSDSMSPAEQHLRHCKHCRKTRRGPANRHGHMRNRDTQAAFEELRTVAADGLAELVGDAELASRACALKGHIPALRLLRFGSAEVMIHHCGILETTDL